MTRRYMKPLIYAHRGGAGLYPENTLHAFASCVRLGVDVLDMDICMNYDGEIVVSHAHYLDPDLTQNSERFYITEHSILIKDLSLEELKHYNVGAIKPGVLQEERTRPLQRVDFASIPTLREVLQLGKKLSHNRVHYQIEIKHDAKHPKAFCPIDTVIQKLLECLYSEQVIHLTEVQCFDWDVLIKIQQLEKTLATAFLSPSSHYHFTDSLPKTIHHLGGTIWGPEYQTLSQELVQEAHHLHLKVIPWTVNTIDAMDMLISWGIDGIITDRPDVLKARLFR
jgi:glycerophosphoryl diester phosphodiesterase